MRVIVAGTRDIGDYTEVVRAIELSQYCITELVSGKARGPDSLAEIWAESRTPPIPIESFPAEWDKYGKRAGFIRNEAMARSAEALVAVWDGRSSGTADMIKRARSHGLLVYVHLVNT